MAAGAIRNNSHHRRVELRVNHNPKPPEGIIGAKLSRQNTANIQSSSVIGTQFAGRVIGETAFAPHEVIIPQMEGSAYITGRHEFLIDPDGPLKKGFIHRCNQPLKPSAADLGP